MMKVVFFSIMEQIEAVYFSAIGVKYISTKRSLMEIMQNKAEFSTFRNTAKLSQKTLL